MEAPERLSTDQVERLLGSDCRRGLSDSEAAVRLEWLGPNLLNRETRPRYAGIAVRQFLDPLVALLVVAAAISAGLGQGIEAAAIAAIVVLNAALGFGQEAGAERAVLALRQAIADTASVIREGRERLVPIAEIVPGDLVALREGELVPADGRMVSAHGLALDESLLTGESMPEDKTVDPVPRETPLADRSSMVFAGTTVTRGRGHALVTAAGRATELGRIADLTSAAVPPPTPLQRRVRRLARTMAALGVALTVLLAGASLAYGASLDEAFLVGVSVAVAAVPEGLVAAVTIALALGARAMARHGAITRRLTAVETLGSATVVASDKTGTLTENRLRLAAAAPAWGRSESELLAAAVLASTASLIDEDGGVRVAGDPVDGALLLAARERGISRAELLEGRTLLRELPFDSHRKRMTLVYAEPAGARAFVKGAPEVVLERSLLALEERRRLEAIAASRAEQGLRVLAVAERPVDDPGEDDETLERGLVPLGLVALHDPLRETAAQAVHDARSAGLRVELLTGDHRVTARAIARALDLPAGAVHARVTPADKLELVERLQAEGEVVAVTGDGVNDAPALRRADVGVAMGRSGTDAAREAADIVLTDDDFSTIVAAIREGRVIADNIRKFVAFLLSANLGEVMLFGIAVLAGLGAPMTVVQVLLVNVLTDGLPAVALTRDPGSDMTMRRAPERGDRLFSRPVWGALALVGGFAALAAFLVGRAAAPDEAQTMAFATIALAALALVFTMRSSLHPAWQAPRNPYLLASVLASVALVVLALYLPLLQDALGTARLSLVQIGIVVALALVPAAVLEAGKAAARRFGTRRESGQSP
ncbi:MAG TPA: cation-transporting P-type ATPase [Gaiellaceae bacterium]|nr:cation-transporting P-type ATPase [Gaiellaceae bacterium]